MGLRTFIVASLCVLVVPALAQRDDPARVCAAEVDAPLDQRIAACTAVIGAGKLEGHELAVVHNRRGGWHYYGGDAERALADYDQAIKLSPHFVHAHNNRCWAGAVIGRLQQAIEDCGQVLKLTNIANTFENRGFAFLKLGRFDLALADYELALKLDGPRADLLYGRGFARIRRGDAGGEADVAAAKALNPKIAEEFARYGLK